MKFCKHCSVNVHDALSNCPICGSYVNENKSEIVYPAYEAMEKDVKYPEIKIKKNVARTGRLVSLFILLACALSIPINLLLTKDVLWCVWVCFGGIAAISCVISPVFNQKKIYLQISLDILYGCALLFLLDYFDGIRFTSQTSWSIQYGIPALLFASIVGTDFMIIFMGKREKAYLLTMYYLCVLSLAPEIIMWALPKEFVTWATFTLFFFALANALTVTIILFKTVKEEFGKKFNL